MSFLSRLSLANKSVVALVTLIIVVIGAYVIPSLRQELMPPLVLPAVSIVTVYPGASPAQVEQDVTNQIEQAIQGQAGITQTASQSSEGLSLIRVSYDFGTDLDKAQQKLQQKINQIQNSLPSDVTPQLQTFNFNDLPVLTLAVSSSANQQDLVVALKKLVVPALQSIKGVGTVNITGVRQQIVTISLDLQKMQAAGIQMQQVMMTLQQNNTLLPAGEVNSNGQIMAVRVGNTLNSLQALKELPLVPGNSDKSSASQPAAPVKLGNIATVQQDLAPSSTLSRVNGKSSLGIALIKTANGDTVSISDAVNNALGDLQHKLGHQAKITVVEDQAPYIRSSIADLVREGLLGAGFAIVVILLFLTSVRSTIVTAISIPLSVILALIALWAQNYSLNIMTLSGLTIAVGRVVDDSIVVLENIYRHMRMGEPRKSAAFNGAKEVATAVTSSTLTTVAVFLPLAFMGGMVGQFTHAMAMTVTFALLASLLVALTIIPVLAYWFLAVPKDSAKQKLKANKPSILERAYVPMISWVTSHRIITVSVSILLLVGSCLLFVVLPTNVYGNMGGSSFALTMTLPKNTTLDRTNQAAMQVENVLARIKGIHTYQTVVGTSNAGFVSATVTNVASFTVTVDPGVDVEHVRQSVSDALKKLSSVGTVTFPDMGGGTSQDLQIQAPDDATLQKATQQVVDRVKKHASTTNVKSNLSEAVPLIDVHVDPAKAARYGLNAQTVAQLLRVMYSGTTATTVVLDANSNTREDVNLKIKTSATTVQDMQKMLLVGPIRLSDVADVSLVNGPVQLSHANGVRAATVTFDVTSQDIQGVGQDVLQQVKQLKLPAGVQVSQGIGSSESQDTLNQLFLALLFAIPLVFIIMVVTFRSLLQPLILLVSIPFAAIGSIILAVVTQTPIGVSSLLGALMLVGIVVTNAIVLIDCVNHYRAQGMDARSAVIAGGRQRIRPILMTALATIMATLPTAFGWGESGGINLFSSALGIVVIGGLTSSTLLTLLLVPTLYVIVESVRERFQKKETISIPVNQSDELAVPVV
jgi:HAE1 family hydrophobic/amphiphilic exporter-1